MAKDSRPASMWLRGLPSESADVDPIERRQLIEVHDVIVKGVRNQNQIADVLGVRGISRFSASSTARTLAMA